MNLLDLYEGREPYQQAIDKLEQARIDHLKEKMDYYAKHGMAKEFKAAKEEHDSYFKVQDECMGYGGLTSEAGIPGNVPAEKIPGKEDLLKGKGRQTYEGSEENDDWYDEEDAEETDLRTGDYVRDTLDGEHGEVFRMVGDPYERRVRILDRGGRGWYIEPSRLTRVDPQDSDVQRYFGKQRQRDMDEAGIPGSVPTEKIPGKEDLLKGRGRSYYESQKKNPEEVSSDPAIDRLLTKAHREFPKARSDAEALAMKILGKEQADVARLDQVNDREDTMIDRLADLETNLQQQIDQLKQSAELDEGHMGEIDAMRQDLERMNERQFYTAYGISKTAFQQKYRTLLKPALDEATVNPQFINVQVTKILAGEARRMTNAPMAQLLAPVMKQYNLTLQQIDSMVPGGLKRAAGEYGIMMKEGFQDFNKVEPYAVCLAGRPVKKFDYYEDARRFHDNWKKKLYNQGEQAKADKITLLPLNLDEGFMEPKGGKLNQLITDYANTIRDAWENADYGNDEEADYLYDQASEILGTITANYGDKAAAHAEKAGQSNTFGREGNTHGHGEPDRLAGGLRQGKSQNTTKAGKIPKNTQNAMKNDIKIWGPRINGPQGALPEAISKNDLLGNVAKDLNTQFKKAKSGKLKASGDFTRGDHWQGAKPGDYGYTGYQGHGMPKDNPKKNKGVAEGSFAHDQLKGEINDLFKPVVLQIVKWARAEGMTAKDLAGTSSHFFLDALDPDTYDRTQHLPDNYFNKLMDKANAKAVEILKKKGVAEGDVIPFKRPESKIKPEVRRVFIRHLLDQGYTNDEISRMNDEQFTKAYYGIKGKTKVKDVRPNWTDDLPDELDEQGVAEGLEDSNIQSAIVDTVERLFRKNEISDYGALEAIRQGIKHHFSKPGATTESAIEGILNILDKRMRKSGDYVDLGRFKEALRQGIAHQLNKQGVAEAETDYQKRRQRERDVDAGKPVAKQRQPKMTDYQKRRAQQKREIELGEAGGGWALDPKTRLELKKRKDRQKTIAKYAGRDLEAEKRAKEHEYNNRVNTSNISEEQDTSGVESAIIRRIMVSHTDLLRQFGPEKVMQAAEEVAYNIGDVDEIGTSDVSAYVAQVKQILGAE